MVSKIQKKKSILVKTLFDKKTVGGKKRKPTNNPTHWEKKVKNNITLYLKLCKYVLSLNKYQN